MAIFCARGGAIVSHADLVARSNEIATDLVERQGYTEIKHFHKLHKVHLPCFTWIVENVGCNEENDPQQLLTSRIGGHPAMYPDEEWPKYGDAFAFQINLAEIPARMQCITGKSGLLQLWWDTNGGCAEGFGRVVPAADLGKLEIRIQDPSVPHFVTPSPGAITGWVERADYPSRSSLTEVAFDDDDNDRDSLEEISDSMCMVVDRFGGYGEYMQGCSTKIPCKCGRSHLGRFETFNMAESSVLRFMRCGMTAQVTYCPHDDVDSQGNSVTITCSCD